MSEDPRSSVPPRSEPEPVRRYRDLVGPLMWLGLGLALAGLVIGLVIALRRKETSCADGTYFPEGTTDFRCFAHPHALEGSAVAVFSVIFAVLIVLLAVIAKAVLVGPPPVGSDRSDQQAG